MSKKKPKPKEVEFVLDGSVTLAWFFEDETDEYAEAVEESLTDATAVVPGLWTLEVANAALVGERRKRTTEARVTEFLTLLKALPIRVDEETAERAWDETIRLARSHALSVYDASYLELAIRLSLPLATLDDRLRAAAEAVGVTAYEPA